MNRSLKGLTRTIAGVILIAGCADDRSIVAPDESQMTLVSGVTKNEYTGYAVVLDATVLGINTKLSEAKLPSSSGGAAEASLLTLTVPKLLSAEVAHASTVAQGKRSASEASVADVTLTVAGNNIQASLLKAIAFAECNLGKPTVRGSSHIAQLVINGKAITVTGAPNQTIPLGVGKVIINEQTKTSNSMTVTALHVIVPGAADVVISRARAGVTCSADGACPPAVGDFITGGGWIDVNGKANFGVAGGIKTNGLWGHLEYHDRGASLKVHATSITAYTVTGANSRRIEGTANINGNAGTFKVDVTDNGEPGSSDTFRIRLSNGYTAAGTLKGGNLQLHARPTNCDK